jgi:hypothetical protein
MIHSGLKWPQARAQLSPGQTQVICLGICGLEGSEDEGSEGALVTVLLLVSGCSRRPPDGPGTELGPCVGEEV